jgi:DNA polymerase-3 subunit alpha
MESFDARKMLIDAQASNIEDVVVVNAANRPGTKDSFPDYCKNKLHPDKAEVIHPDLKKLFSQSQNVLMYQEQALSLLRYAGFPEEKVENGRRAIGKKIESEMKTLKPMFIEGLKKKDWGDEQIEAIWNLLLKQSSYCFNR